MELFRAAWAILWAVALLALLLAVMLGIMLGEDVPRAMWIWAAGAVATVVVAAYAAYKKP